MNTDDQLLSLFKTLKEASSTIELSRQMLQLGWNATTVLQRDLQEVQEVNGKLAEEHAMVREEYNKVSQDFVQCRKIAQAYQQQAKMLNNKLRASEEEKQLMRKVHREALEVAADRISDLERKLDEVRTHSDSAGEVVVVEKRKRGPRRKNRNTRKVQPAEPQSAKGHKVSYHTHYTMHSRDSDKPLPSIPVDIQTPRQSVKTISPAFPPPPNAAQLLRRRTCENARLQKEVACYREQIDAAMTLFEDLCLIHERLQHTLTAFQDALKELDRGGGDISTISPSA
ncbi:hypothetical protein BU23DRAFT_574405 [Bimuria novae-zelandiae CBS 107.79]|uniref:Uncharacterized protein n=1 Tax=Bimuria novae-zelandiae CBS 107.79 TaxID=1447943 RepID=A0A6A5UM87_9PLEO|nr:hypothetical protein BU23DRAFT_574405 [Bimuria novae-zelandiae CBS 107.79]